MDMLADELEAQNVVFRNIEQIPIEVQNSLDQDYVLQNKSAFLSARFLVRNFMILSFLEQFIVGNYHLEYFVTYLVGTSVLSPELFQVLNQAKKLSVKLATMQNSQVIKNLPNVVNLELGGLIFQQQFPKMEKIQSLTISNMFKSSLGFGADLNLIGQFSTLTEINLGSNAKVDLKEILGHLSPLKKLKVINLRFYLVKILNFQQILNFQELERFSANFVVMEEGWNVSDLSQLTNLREISLNFYQINNNKKQQTKNQRGQNSSFHNKYKNQKFSYLSSELDYFSRVIDLKTIHTQVGNSIQKINPFVKLQLLPKVKI
eukprot:TRINITY_DN3221_c0_g1_i8.p1 TRINITY_DN3221_c0_g1~~TRINITY_DN3221_c0_g1_i8.p1  ORF type:complete len:318 (+),score=55.24 TRINITY_DN3221_c0_g1_i8:915-1868(+)